MRQLKVRPKQFVVLFIAMLAALAPLSHAQTPTISTLSGNPGQMTSDGTGASARFNNPSGVAVDTNGNIYVAETDSHCIRKITSAGVVTTIAGLAGVSGSANGTGSNARFNSPQGIAVDNAGNIFVTDSGNHTIRTITSAGVVTTLAGSAGLSGTTDATGSNARFNNPEGIVLSGTKLYIADAWNHTIRAISTNNGTVTTFAGTAGTPSDTDGNGTSASFNTPQGIAVDASGNLYIADTGNQLIRMITTSATVTTIAGVSGAVGSADGPTGSALFSDPTGIAVDSANNVYVADAFNNTMRKITSGNVSTPVGMADTLGSADGTGSAASFWQPQGLAVDVSGNVYVADGGNGTIRKISGTTVTTIAGAASIGSADGTSYNARFFFPADACITDSGTTYVADTFNHTIRAINNAGSVTTLAGLAGVSGTNDGTGAGSRFNAPEGLALDGSGNLFVADTANHTIREVTSSGSVSLFAGTAGTAGWADATGSAALFNSPQDVALDSSGNVYVADTWNHVIREITPAGVVTTLAGQAMVPGDSDGTGANVGTNVARFYAPGGLTVDSSGNVYVADTRNHLIRQVTPDGVVSTIAGLGSSYGSTDGASNNARFFLPQSIAIDANGNLFVLDSGNQTIREMTQSGGVWTVSTIAGTPGVIGSADGTGSSAKFFNPAGIAVNSSGIVVVADLANNTIRTSGSIAPTILTSPSSQSVALGSDAVFSAVASGTSLSYQWYFNNGIISGASSSSYTKSNAQTTDAGSYSVVANNNLGSATSSSAVLSVIIPPSISTQPQSQTVGIGTNVTLSVVASGTSPSYQWQKNNSDIAGATSSSLSLPSVSHNDDASYTVIVSNSANSVTSIVATVTVLDPPTISTQPISMTVAFGAPTQFTVVATGQFLSYQWQKNGGAITGANGTALSFASVADTDAANYTVVVLNAAGAATSIPATLTVVDPPIITQPPVSQTIATGSTAQFTVTATNGALRYQWQKNGGAINGATTSVLALPGVSQFDVASYRVIVTNIAGGIVSTAATLSVMDPPVITQQPADVTADRGDTVQFTVTATGTSLNYQWRKNGSPISNATNSTLTLPAVVPLSAGSYDVVITNLVGSVTSTSAVLTVTCANIVVTPATLPTINLLQTPQNIVASGGAGPYDIEITAGTLPEGLTLQTNGVWTGSALAFCTNPITIMATDSNGCFTIMNYTLTVGPGGNANDLTKPLVILQSPINRFVATSPDITVSGTAVDVGMYKSGVALVRYSFNSSSPQLVTTANNYANWSADVTLQPGWNIFTAQAVDFRGNYSLIASNIYFLGAKTNVLGAYNGLFFETDGLGNPAIKQKTAGAVQSLIVNFIGGYSGTIYIDGAHYQLKGTFDLSGNSTVYIERVPQQPLQVTMNLDWAGTTKQITGTVSCPNDGWSAPLVADLAVYNASNLHTPVRYTMAIPPANDAPTASPGGYGYGLISINAIGTVSISGLLADLSPISRIVPISKDGRMPVYVNLYKNQGLLEGWLDFSSGAPTGQLTWIKPSNPNGVTLTTYLNGFTNIVDVLGSAYSANAPAITPADGLLEITDGSGLNLPLTFNAGVSSIDTIVKSGGITNGLSGTIARGTGLITVNFRPTGLRITKTARGVVLQNNNTAYGAFLGNDDGTGKTNTGAMYFH